MRKPETTIKGREEGAGHRNHKGPGPIPGSHGSQGDHNHACSDWNESEYLL